MMLSYVILESAARDKVRAIMHEFKTRVNASLIVKNKKKKEEKSFVKHSSSRDNGFLRPHVVVGSRNRVFMILIWEMKRARRQTCRPV